MVKRQFVNINSVLFAHSVAFIQPAIKFLRKATTENRLSCF